jgi:hypothetical protein
MGPAKGSSLLQRTLLADGVLSGTSAIALVFGAGFLDELLGLPAELLRTAGISLIPFVGFVFYLSRREQPARGNVLLVIALNLLWVAASVLLLLSSRVNPNSVGFVFIVAQAVVVAAFAEIQWVGLRKAASAHAFS